MSTFLFDLQMIVLIFHNAHVYLIFRWFYRNLIIYSILIVCRLFNPDTINQFVVAIDNLKAIIIVHLHYKNKSCQNVSYLNQSLGVDFSTRPGKEIASTSFIFLTG